MKSCQPGCCRHRDDGFSQGAAALQSMNLLTKRRGPSVGLY